MERGGACKDSGILICSVSMPIEPGAEFTGFGVLCPEAFWAAAAQGAGARRRQRHTIFIGLDFARNSYNHFDFVIR